MASRHSPVNVGSPDPTLKTSPIMEELDDSYEELAQELEDAPACYFNDVMYQHDAYVCSGSGELLHCEKGVWVQKGGCDTDNP